MPQISSSTGRRPAQQSAGSQRLDDLMDQRIAIRDRIRDVGELLRLLHQDMRQTADEIHHMMHQMDEQQRH
jgi:hypothetical protein